MMSARRIYKNLKPPHSLLAALLLAVTLTPAKAADAPLDLPPAIAGVPYTHPMAVENPDNLSLLYEQGPDTPSWLRITPDGKLQGTPDAVPAQPIEFSI